MLVIMTNVDREGALEVPSIQDQHPIEALTADGADPSLDERVRAGCLCGRAIVRMPSERNTSSNAAVNLLSRSWIRNRSGCVRSTNVSMMLRALLVASRLVVYGLVEVVFRGCRGARAVGERGATAAGPGDS